MASVSFGTKKTKFGARAKTAPPIRHISGNEDDLDDDDVVPTITRVAPSSAALDTMRNITHTTSNVPQSFDSVLQQYYSGKDDDVAVQYVAQQPSMPVPDDEQEGELVRAAREKRKQARSQQNRRTTMDLDDDEDARIFNNFVQLEADAAHAYGGASRAPVADVDVNSLHLNLKSTQLPFSFIQSANNWLAVPAVSFTLNELNDSLAASLSEAKDLCRVLENEISEKKRDEEYSRSQLDQMHSESEEARVLEVYYRDLSRYFLQLNRQLEPRYDILMGLLNSKNTLMLSRSTDMTSILHEWSTLTTDTTVPSLDDVITRMNEWKVMYPTSYSDAYGDECCFKLFSYYIQTEMLPWMLFSNNYTRLTHMHWYIVISSYSMDLCKRLIASVICGSFTPVLFEPANEIHCVQLREYIADIRTAIGVSSPEYLAVVRSAMEHSGTKSRALVSVPDCAMSIQQFLMTEQTASK